MSHLRLAVWVPLVVLSLSACTGGSEGTDGEDGSTAGDDDDGGGLPGGGDPDADSDADGLTDAEELGIGSDPDKADSDEDTYLDSWEVTEGKDPLDPDSRIYTGYWPYNPDKAEDVGFDGSTLEPGEKVGNHVGRDQFGQKVELYDFFDHDKDILIDASAQWCGPCQATALWLSTHGAIDYMGLESEFSELRKAVDNGDIYWVTILVENNNYGNTTEVHVAQWDADFPHENVPVLTDTDDNFMEGVIYKTGFYPSGMLLNPQGKVVKIGGMDVAMREAQNRLAD